MDNPNLLIFSRTDPKNTRNKVLVIGNFNIEPQSFHVDSLKSHGFFQHNSMKDLCTGTHISVENDILSIPSLASYWLT